MLYELGCSFSLHFLHLVGLYYSRTEKQNGRLLQNIKLVKQCFQVSLNTHQNAKRIIIFFILFRTKKIVGLLYLIWRNPLVCCSQSFVKYLNCSVSIKFNNKMQQLIGQEQPEIVLSPKQTEHHRFRTATLQKIDHQIEKIITLNSIQSQHYKDSIEKINLIENSYQLENKQLRKALSVLKDQHESLQKMYLSLKEQFQANLLVCQKLEQQNKGLSKEVGKLKAMVRNQENLIDEYRKSIQEEIALQKELIKSECEQEKAKMSKSFNRALQQLEKQFEQKFRKLQKQEKIRQYKNEFNEAKQYFISREPSRAALHQKALKPSQSEYSTAEQEGKSKEQQTKGVRLQKGQYDQQNKHNQPIFLV